MKAVENHLAAARIIINNDWLSTPTAQTPATPQLIPRVYRGYISSFGVDVRQSGVLPTLLLYSATDGSAQGDRGKIVAAVGKLLTYATPQAFIDRAFAVNADTAARNKFRRDVMDAAVALKLAMRTFAFEPETTTP